MEIIGEEGKVPEFGQFMTRLKEWGPEYEVSFQIKFSPEPASAPWTKNIFRFTIFNDDSFKSGSNIPAMWKLGRTYPFSMKVATSIDNVLKDWAMGDPFGTISFQKYYDVLMKQYKGKVIIIHCSLVFSYFEKYLQDERYYFDIYFDNNLMATTKNLRPEMFEDVEVYFSDKYYPAANSSVRNFFACQGINETLYFHFQLEFKSEAK